MDTKSPFQCLIDSGLITEDQAQAIIKIPSSYANMIVAGMVVAGAQVRGAVAAADVYVKTIPGKRYSLLIGYAGENFGGGAITPKFSSDNAGTNTASIPAPGEYLASSPISFTEYGSLEFVAADNYLVISPDTTVAVSFVLSPIS